MPPTVRDAVGARLARASAGARRAVKSAAVIGARVDPSLLAWLLADAAGIGRRVLATGILVPDGTGLRFRHELVRMAVEAGIAAHRKTELHVRLLAGWKRAAPTRPCWPTTPRARAMRRPCCGTPRRRPGVRPPWAHIARRRHSMNGPFVLQKILTSRRWRHCMRARPTSTALLDRWEDAEGARRAALALRRELGDDLSVGANLRNLSRTLWRLCRGPESEQAAGRLFRSWKELPPGRELAWAYATLPAA